eukprot:TRINITY_DN279_c1_g1_i9.p1 TRINITY_DN279_c1_g1~~TRINITY_DN279_c1_g1_i9.p1  ORF type:complete len:820 (-),score=470.30 TRINITY_DN279_c1_g1_i9:204-2639(-)
MGSDSSAEKETGGRRSSAASSDGAAAKAAEEAKAAEVAAEEKAKAEAEAKEAEEKAKAEAEEKAKAEAEAEEKAKAEAEAKEAAQKAEMEAAAAKAEAEAAAAKAAEAEKEAEAKKEAEEEAKEEAKEAKEEAKEAKTEEKEASKKADKAEDKATEAAAAATAATGAAASSSSSSSSAAAAGPADDDSGLVPIACDGSGEGVHWTTDPAGVVPLKVTASGPGSEKPLTVMNVFDDAAARYPDKVALREKRDGATTWTELTYKEYHAQVLRMARALVKIGVRAHSGVAILGFNSFEWFIADLAAIYAGAMAAGIYTTNGPEACHYIVEHCDAEVCFVQNEAQLKKILEVRDRLPALKAIVVWQGELPADMDDSVMTWEQMIALGDDESLEAPLTERIAAQEPGHCCTLIYTSGTTGNPKAVMITHDNVTWTARTTSNVLEIDNDSQIISYLPLSHIAAQMVDIHAPLVSCGTVSFARPDALKGTLGDTLKEVRPTVFLGVPRVWEKIGDKMKAIGAKTTGLKKTISTWAKKKGLEGGYADQQGKSKGMMFGLANSLVFSKVKAGLGLDRCKIQCTAAAPISVETLEYFLQLNIPIYEVYGMSECTGPQTVSYPKNYKTGSCGKSLTGTRLELADKDAEGNGEICFRGRHIFAGYLKNPEATGQTIDGNGFLHSGDVGALDGGGFLKITGRIKELIITAGGENVPPVLIENSIKAEAPFNQQRHGHRRQAQVPQLRHHAPKAKAEAEEHRGRRGGRADRDPRRRDQGQAQGARARAHHRRRRPGVRQVQGGHHRRDQGRQRQRRVQRPKGPEV